MKRLYRAAAEAGLIVVEGDIPSHESARYYHSHRVIVLRSGMSAVDTHTALGHELGHAHHGHSCSQDAGTCRKQERQADEYAAQLLITPVEYREAERIYGHHVSGLALHLGVTPRIVRAWQELWLRKGTHGTAAVTPADQEGRAEEPRKGKASRAIPAHCRHRYRSAHRP
ncbi:ImmA/IrrE family metallo-endopeptidase [Rhodococcus hoagii]|nr:ImmA/IrrE family metallo-endopeptidase [Prescottella equi]NKZ94663.1 ImmA/IrrE family metallo-endopeptidase [Prescottella equi]